MRKQKQILKGGIRGEVARTLCGLLWVLAIFSCDRSEVSPEATTGPATQGPEATPRESDDGSSEHPRTTAFRSSLPDSLDLDTPVARMGTEEILAEDLERKILQISLYEGIPAAQMFSQEQLRDPFVLHSLVEQILQDRALYEQGELLGILPTETEVMAAWHADPTLAEVELPGAEVSGRFPDGRVRLTREQVLRPLLLQVLHGRWTERQVENVTEDTVRNEWFFENQSISVTSYEIRNVATRDDVDAFLQNPPSEAWFEEQYDARRAMFRRPESVDLRVVGVSVERPDGEARIREMRDRVLLGADMVRMSMVESDHPASATEGLIQAVRRDESPEVYSAQLGAVGEVRREGEYWLFERVEAVQPAGYAPLDDEAKRRLVSAYLAFHEPLERYQSAAVSIREALESGDQEALQAILDGNRVWVREVDEIHRDPTGLVASVGHAPELLAELFGMDEVGQVSGPHFYEGSVWVFQITNISRPDAADYEAAREEFRPLFDEIIRQSAWPAYWQEQLDSNSIDWLLPDGYLMDSKADMPE